MTVYIQKRIYHFVL